MLKKVLPIIILAATAFTSCQPSKDTYRKDFVKGCVNRFAKDSTVASTEGRKLVEEYCNCQGDKLNAQMNAEQWRTFNKSGNTSLAQFQDILQPCFDDFQKKLSTLKPASAED